MVLPWLTWFSIVAIVAVILSMAVVDDEATRSYLIPSLISLAVVVAAAFICGRREQSRPADSRSPSGPPAQAPEAIEALGR